MIELKQTKIKLSLVKFLNIFHMFLILLLDNKEIFTISYAYKSIKILNHRSI